MSSPAHENGSDALTRRAFLGGAGTLIGAVAVGRQVADLLGASEAFAHGGEFCDYWAVTPEFHRRQTETLPSLGFRLVSLSLYDYDFHGFDGPEPRYAAVWLKRSGPAQRFVQDLGSADFQSAVIDFARARFKPTIIAATTSFFAHNLFAAAFEKMTDDMVLPVIKLRLTSGEIGNPNTIEYWMEQARWGGRPANYGSLLPKDRSRPSTLTVYGTRDRPLFAGVWEPNPEAVAWGVGGIPGERFTDSFEEYQRRVEAELTVWSRPAHVTVSPFVRYLSVIQDDQLGDPSTWAARHGMTQEAYERERERLIGLGLVPRVVQAGGYGSGVRYAALFSKRESPIPRNLTLRDCDDLPKNDIDVVIEEMMRANGIRQAALAVVHNRKLVFARGCTLAEPDYPLATATTYFRVASCSKVLTAMMVMRLVQQRHLRLEDKIQDILQLKAPNGKDGPADPRFKQVTIQQALTRFSGLRDGFHVGPEVVRAFGCIPEDPEPPSCLPASARQIASYEVGQPDPKDPLMIRNPGEAHPSNRFSDFGYLLVSLVVEKIAGPNGESFAQIVKERVGTPLSATRIRNAANLISEQSPDEARYHNPRLPLEWSVISDDRPLVPLEYGAGNLVAGAATGGLSVAAVDFARLLASLNVTRSNPLLNEDSINTMLRDFIGWDYPLGCEPPDPQKPHDCKPDPPFHRVKGGLLGGAQAVANFTQGQLAYVVFWTRSDVRGIDVPKQRTWYPEFPDLTAAVKRVFPDFGAARNRWRDFEMPPF